jgi:hypothetical protein
MQYDWIKSEVDAPWPSGLILLASGKLITAFPSEIAEPGVILILASLGAELEA